MDAPSSFLLLLVASLSCFSAAADRRFGESNEMSHFNYYLTPTTIFIRASTAPPHHCHFAAHYFPPVLSVSFWIVIVTPGSGWLAVSLYPHLGRKNKHEPPGLRLGIDIIQPETEKYWC